MSKKIWVLIMVLLLSLSVFITGCSNGAKPQSDKPVVITTLYPQYDFAKAVAGDVYEVSLLLPPGVEAHAFEPTPKDIVDLQNAKLFIYTGEAMEPWVHTLEETLDKAGVKTLDLSEDVVLLEHAHEEEHEEEHGDFDPHYWTDPLIAMTMVDEIVAAFSEASPEHSNTFVENGKALKLELEALDKAIVLMLEKTKSKTILSGGHFAFGYFAHRYGLEHMAPYEGFSPNAEPTPQKIAELIETIKSTDAKALFYEELVDPKVAKVISDETGVEILLLHGVHNVSKEDLDAGKTYLDFMYDNIENLKIGLGYVE